ncbi:MAG TPA: hypothetical protein PLS29_06300 [Acidimicrobiales bacterium]|nr:hypothetical protein [Acidimicrobiales bacterium]
MRSLRLGGTFGVLVATVAIQAFAQAGALNRHVGAPVGRAGVASGPTTRAPRSRREAHLAPSYHPLGAISSSRSSDGSYYLAGWDAGTLPPGTGAGFSWYSLAWPITPTPIAGFQLGLSGTWITPSDPSTPMSTIEHLCDTSTNQGITQTVQDPSSGRFGLQLFQTIEGGLGWWANERFKTATPKYIVNVTSNCYDSQVGTPGWGTFAASPLARDQTGFAQLSNRILMPPDGMTLDPASTPGDIGTNWAALNFPVTGPPGAVATGDNDWTIFLNAANFHGPLGYVVPQFWSEASQANPYQRGLTLDTRPGMAYSLAQEWNSIPYFETTDASGSVFSKIPALQFPVDASGQTVIAQDFSTYGPGALASPLSSALASGGPLPTALDPATVTPLALSPSDAPIYQDGAAVPELNRDLTLSATPSGNGLALDWGTARASSTVSLPQLFERQGSTLTSTLSSPAPASLSAAAFPAASSSAFVYRSPRWWDASPAASPTLTARLSDGSEVTYRWYKFVDQPALQQFDWTSAQKAAMQAIVVTLQRQWDASALMAPPTSGSLAAFDHGLLVTPPKGLAYGYVPIVTGQRAAPAGASRPLHTLVCVRGAHRRRVSGRPPRCPSGWRAA